MLHIYGKKDMPCKDVSCQGCEWQARCDQSLLKGVKSNQNQPEEGRSRSKKWDMAQDLIPYPFT